ncbi:Copper amine oxidase N-terminal domain-containing protein [Paenibacillus catalpae]|uniref:Copper amine oxidase N-terminal domain-containing protein n=1 Tax=Paenibacillus catalpae TaxID=1045775 RepID=A0A1I2B1Y0_9BACL|nr:Gmad2 immunoglobulin-like domain-containing protein [Paenibacillus catalpae]SFE49273.1 Copper amine oxidase N-terminal domain-containing protein [Paenibacillus catalpae]
MLRGYKGFIVGLLMGGLLMTALPSMAATNKTTYSLTEAGYPIEVNGTVYTGQGLPVLNYKGNTYVPLRAVGDMLGASVAWNNKLGKVVISSELAPCNSAFCDVKVSGSGGHYTVSGKGRVFEAVMQYAVEDGHNYLLEGHQMLNEGAPAWSPFSLDIILPPEQLPSNGTLMLELFEYSAEDGSRINALSIPLETFGTN